MKNNHDILIVEDGKADREIALVALNKLGVKNNIVFASSGQEALNYLRSSEKIPFLIISDLKMPGMSGLDLLKAIQEDKNLKLKSAPFIFFTTSDEENDIVKAYEYNAHGYFKKPYNIEDLEKILKLTIEYWENAQLPPKKSEMWNISTKE